MKKKSKSGSVKVNIKGDFDPEKMCKGKCKGKGMTCGGCGGCFYGLGFIGATVYYISVATGFWVGVLGVLKALVWPGFLVFELFKFLGA